MTEDGLSESLQVNMEISSMSSIINDKLLRVYASFILIRLLIIAVFPGEKCLLNSDGTDELPEEWLVDCLQDREPCCPPEEMYVFRSELPPRLAL
jgi:hypothetical protein